MMESNTLLKKWQTDVSKVGDTPHLKLRLAAMVGHMHSDPIATRRAALVDMLADGKPHLGEAILEAIGEQLGETCWGKRPAETLGRDLKALRKGRIRIGYSRHPESTGYYLKYPAIAKPNRQPFESPNPAFIERLRQLSPAEKLNRAFAMADFALRQKKLILAETHPDWSPKEVDMEARRQVYRAEPIPNR